MANNKLHTKSKVTSGKNSVSAFNFSQFKNAQKGRLKISESDLLNGILKGNISLLAKAITLIESKNSAHQKTAQSLIEKCLPHANKSIRVGITGAPGVGKSTFIESFGLHLLKEGKKVAVLAIDPSSQVSHGSILGDKTRMEKLAGASNAFIRPSASDDSLGGVARKTRETIILCEAAGFDTILIETVGVGQSEIAVHSMVDFFMLLLLPGAGDELQGIKRGIVEMADMIVVNKSDGERKKLAKQTKRAYQNAIHLFPKKESNWVVKTMICSALESAGIPEIWKQISNYKNFTTKNDYFQNNRKNQSKYWMENNLLDNLKRLFYENENVKSNFSLIENSVLEGKISPFSGAEKLLELFLKK